jgi:DNA-binding CsgD family transcriptional regulator
LFPQLFDQLDYGLFRPGTLHGDLFVLLLVTANPALADPVLVEDAVRAVAKQIPWRIHNPRVWRAIRTRAEADQTSDRAIKHRELCAAILLALETRDVPQTLRFGREWVTDAAGRKDPLPPHELATRWFWQWLCNRAIAMAEAAVLERPFPATEDVLDRPRRNGRPESVISLDAGWERTDGGEALDLLLVDESDPLTVLIAQHEHDEDAARLRAVLEVATPRQRQLLALIGAGHSEAAAARQLGLAPSTARVQLLRLRQKVM